MRVSMAIVMKDCERCGSDAEDMEIFSAYTGNGSYHRADTDAEALLGFHEGSRVYLKSVEVTDLDEPVPSTNLDEPGTPEAHREAFEQRMHRRVACALGAAHKRVTVTSLPYPHDGKAGYSVELTGKDGNVLACAVCHIDNVIGYVMRYSLQAYDE